MASLSLSMYNYYVMYMHQLYFMDYMDNKLEIYTKWSVFYKKVPGAPLGRNLGGGLSYIIE